MEEQGSKASNLGRLNLKDVLHSLMWGAITGGILALGGIVSQANFDLFTVDWASVGHILVNSAFVVTVGNIVRLLGTDSAGRAFGRL